MFTLPVLVAYGLHGQRLFHVRAGAVYKERHARGGGVREGVTVCDKGGQEPVTSHL